jgi:hypothetical protein
MNERLCRDTEMKEGKRAIGTFWLFFCGISLSQNPGISALQFQEREAKSNVSGAAGTFGPRAQGSFFIRATWSNL